MRLAQQVAIVTGGARGIGLAYGQRLADEGAAVVLADLAEGGEDFARLAGSGARVRFVRCDVRSPEHCARLADETRREFGRIDILVNNAALFTTLKRQPLEALTPRDWEDVLGVNVVGVFNCVKAVVGVMKAQGRGKIINVASNVVQKGLPLLLHYVASKGAIVAMTRALARELGPHGITVNAIAPGYVLHEQTAATDAGRNEVVVKLRALGRTQTPADLVGTVAFLASADSDFITGQTLVVDGGEVFA
ncbi:MAG: 3-oxoacyl-ACP reductase FabG [Phycisphaerales bacterium]|nr:3-oxoacyl-ACP reductase FabG [Phycisphaerales bacterium]